MPTMHHITKHIKRYGLDHKQLYALSFMLLFWAIFDGILSYLAPILITQHGLTKTEMGFILSASSIAGAIFDITICRFIAKAHYRKIFIAMFGVCLIYPIFLWGANTFTTYLFAMALWGFYYNLRSFGTFDFIVRRTSGHERTSSFGVIQAFTSLGYLLAPLLAGLAISQIFDWQPFILAWIFIIISIAFYFLLIQKTRKDKSWQAESEGETKKNFLLEMRLWREITTILLPLLFLTICLGVFDSTFWTLGPLLAQESSGFGKLGGLLVTVYQFPILFLGWFIGSFTSRFGKKRTAFISFLVGSLIIAFLFLAKSPFALLLIVFLSSCAVSIAWPAINGAYADYLDESGKISSEIASIENFFSNIGYIIGPMLSGILADSFGESATLSIIGICGVFISFILLRITPKRINVEKELEPDIV